MNCDILLKNLNTTYPTLLESLLDFDNDTQDFIFEIIIKMAGIYLLKLKYCYYYCKTYT